MVFVITPVTTTMGSIISRFYDDGVGRFDYLAAIHLASAMALMTVGMILSKTDCLPSAAHYLEDPRCSNALCGLFSWIPMCAISPILMTGSAEDIAVTFVDALGGITLFVPLVEEPLLVFVGYAAYVSIAYARILHLCSSEVDNCVSLTPYHCRLTAVLLLIVLFCQMRIRYLIMTWTQLTADRLEERTGTESEAEPQMLERSQLVYVLDKRADGKAAEIERNVWSRRRLYKAELTGRLLWAIHFSRQMLPESEVLDHILAFLHEPVRPVTTYVGLLPHDRQSMISSTEHTIASSGVFSSLSSLSSLSSVAVLRKALSARLWVTFGRPPSEVGKAKAEQAASGNCNVFVP